MCILVNQKMVAWKQKHDCKKCKYYAFNGRFCGWDSFGCSKFDIYDFISDAEVPVHEGKCIGFEEKQSILGGK